MDCSPPGSSVHGVLQARIQEWVAIFFSRGTSQPRDQKSLLSPALEGRLFLSSATWKPICMCIHPRDLGDASGSSRENEAPAKES